MSPPFDNPLFQDALLRYFFRNRPPVLAYTTANSARAVITVK